MKDMLGREIKVGDTVVHCVHGSIVCDLIIGRVISVCDINYKLEPLVRNPSVSTLLDRDPKKPMGKKWSVRDEKLVTVRASHNTLINNDINAMRELYRGKLHEEIKRLNDVDTKKTKTDE